MWLDGNINLVVPEHEYGQSDGLCAKVPSVVNYVSACDCKENPLCESSTVDRFTYYFSMETIVKETIKAPVTISCRSFRQLEVTERSCPFQWQALASQSDIYVRNKLNCPSAL
jgi:hypothetical protein